MQPSESDYRAVEQLLFRYAWMVDRRKWELMDEVFSPDGTIDYASTGGPGVMPYRAALEWLDRALAPWPFNLHHITNIAVDIDGDRGESRCYFTAPMARPTRTNDGGGGQDVVTNAGYYLDTLVRTPQGWRIAARTCDMTVQIGSVPSDYTIPD
jgi:3-phenylpropionate/cinnamic acid dioxygenase small subunit